MRPRLRISGVRGYDKDLSRVQEVLVVELGFKPVDQTLVTGQRDTTTVPGQALFLLNSAFVRKQSLALA